MSPRGMWQGMKANDLEALIAQTVRQAKAELDAGVPDHKDLTIWNLARQVNELQALVWAAAMSQPSGELKVAGWALMSAHAPGSTLEREEQMTADVTVYTARQAKPLVSDNLRIGPKALRE